MQINKIQNQNSFKGFHYDKNCRYLVNRFVNPKAFPKVYEDLKNLGRRADIRVKMTQVPINEHTAEPVIEYTIKPHLIRRIFGIKPYTNKIYVAHGFAQKCANILPLELERAMVFLRLG